MQLFRMHLRGIVYARRTCRRRRLQNIAVTRSEEKQNTLLSLRSSHTPLTTTYIVKVINDLSLVVLVAVAQ